MDLRCDAYCDCCEWCAEGTDGDFARVRDEALAHSEQCGAVRVMRDIAIAGGGSTTAFATVAAPDDIRVSLDSADLRYDGISVDTAFWGEQTFDSASLNGLMQQFIPHLA